MVAIAMAAAAAQAATCLALALRHLEPRTLLLLALAALLLARPHRAEMVTTHLLGLSPQRAVAAAVLVTIKLAALLAVLAAAAAAQGALARADKVPQVELLRTMSDRMAAAGEAGLAQSALAQALAFPVRAVMALALQSQAPQ